MHTALRHRAVMAAGALFTMNAFAQSAKGIRGPSPLIAIENEAPAKLVGGTLLTVRENVCSTAICIMMLPLAMATS